MALSEFVRDRSYDEIEGALRNTIYSHDELAAGLISAIERRDVRILSLLLERGADPNHVLKYDWAPLHIAVEYELEDMVRTLVAHGADINLRDQSGSTALHVAVDLE